MFFPTPTGRVGGFLHVFFVFAQSESSRLSIREDSSGWKRDGLLKKETAHLDKLLAEVAELDCRKGRFSRPFEATDPPPRSAVGSTRLWLCPNRFDPPIRPARLGSARHTGAIDSESRQSKPFGDR